MKTLFRNTGYKLFTKQEENSKKISFSYIKNPDGAVRWFWNSDSSNPLFLKFYNAATPKAKLFEVLVKTVFALRLQKIVFKKEVLYYVKNSQPVFNIENDWAIFTGTVGPNNKALLFSGGYFYKIAETDSAKKLIATENKILSKIISRSKLEVPNALMLNENIIQLSDISNSGVRKNSFTKIHADAVMAISAHHNRQTKISDWNYFRNLRIQFSKIEDERIPKNITRKINTILKHIDEQENIEVAFSQGDFTSWNCYVKNEKLAVYDWELSSTEKPKAFDFFHFIIQNGILIQKKSWKEIYAEITEKNKMTFRFSEEDLLKYLKYYLLTNTLSYLTIYAAQEEWHMQIHWLLQTWNEALNIILKNYSTERELVILDIFDALYHTDYAALKFHNEEPEKLKLNSDIDLIISSDNAQKLVSYLSGHSLVQKVSTVKKSFMQTVRIVTLQNEILNLDLIHQVKWKHIQIMEVSKILENRRKNRFGVYKVSEKDTARFIDLFYSLNNAEIPAGYKQFTSEHLKSNKITDRELTIKTLKMKNENRGFSYFKNIVHYLKDSFAEKGFIITFSGVDGAGKSTVISEVSELIEKRYRRPVKILRHRPSLLPILSVWTKGKEKAHEDAVNSLPRQGNNKNSLSSLLRFGYYYTDYILGQFVIYTKYVLRGKIVLYDRYYFDFIADARRSNIQLPKSLTETGYHFLMKPEFNFFLYAAPEKILSRKKELSYHSICDLTSEYSSLFSKLERKNQRVKYLAIENNDLDVTLGTIMNTIITER